MSDFFFAGSAPPPQQDEQQQVPSSFGMVAKMLGLEPLLAATQSPEFHAQVNMLIRAIVETRQKQDLIEQKLDRLIGAIDGTGRRDGNHTALLVAPGTLGPGSDAATGSPVDGRDSGIAPANGTDGTALHGAGGGHDASPAVVKSIPIVATG